MKEEEGEGGSGEGEKVCLMLCYLALSLPLFLKEIGCMYMCIVSYSDSLVVRGTEQSVPAWGSEHCQSIHCPHVT